MFKQAQKGFTLLEVLVSLSILTIGSLGVFALLNRTVLATDVNRNSIVAVNLAREGIELVRGVRDSSSQGFAELAKPCLFVDDCPFIIDNETFSLTEAESTNISNCSTCALYLGSNGYTHDSVGGGTYTGLKRLVLIKDGDTLTCQPGICKVVTVQVLQPKTQTPYTLITYLTDWLQ